MADGDGLAVPSPADSDRGPSPTPIGTLNVDLMIQKLLAFKNDPEKQVDQPFTLHLANLVGSPIQ